MQKSRGHKIVIIVVFPFLWAFFVGDALFMWLSFVSDRNLFSMFLGIYEKKVVSFFPVMDALSIQASFYLSIRIVFGRNEWFDRLYDFSKVLKFTLPFGVALFVYSCFVMAGHVEPLMIRYGPFFYILALGLLIIPIILFQSLMLGLFLRKKKGYYFLTGQYLSFVLFTLLPFVVNHLTKYAAYWIVR